MSPWLRERNGDVQNWKNGSVKRTPSVHRYQKAGYTRIRVCRTMGHRRIQQSQSCPHGSRYLYVLDIGRTTQLHIEYQDHAMRLATLLARVTDAAVLPMLQP